MRTNLPVTGVEYEIDDGTTLMSTTDLRSRVTYANGAFIKVSGYEREELLGQPHNLVRHPDMPAEAFADMWATLKAGKSWTGIVKNRRKNGDHYWVRANVTPIVRDGETVGYMSVRTKPDRSEVRAAEAMYKNMKDGRFTGRQLSHGLVFRTGLLSITSVRKSIPVRWRMRAALGLVACAAAAVLAVAAPALVALFVVLVACALSCLLLETGVARPLEEIERRALALAAGDCTGREQLDRVDEIGMLARAIGQAGLNLKSVVDDVGTQVHALGATAQEVAQASVDLSARTEEAAASLQQTAASMEQLSGNVRSNAGSAGEAVHLASSARDAAESGGSVVSAVVVTMGEIAEASKRIADITGLIDGIAFQTNILALNAAVEAARAGAEGRGFAVVAAEVRSLAQRSASAAREIKALIESSNEKVASGARHADEAGQAIQRIVEQARKVSALVSSITSSSDEQSDGIAQISDAVSELDRSTQQNAAMVEQGAAAAADMRSRTGLLVDAITVYRV